MYAREVLPRLRRMIEEDGGRLTALGHGADLAAYGAELGDARRHVIGAASRGAGPCAAWHLLRAAPVAARLGADVLLLPAANRRTAAVGGVPTVAVVHDLAQLHVRRKYDRARMIYATQILPRSLAQATRLVAVSGATRDDLAQLLPARAGDLRVVANGVDAERFRPRAALAATGAPYLLYVARLEHPGKNHLRLVRAFAASRARRTHQLVLAGADWGAGDAIRAEIARLGLADRVRMAGFVDDAALPGLVGGAAAVLMLGLREGFGLPALEALAAGRPVLAARAGALPEVVGELGVLCDPLDERAIADGLDHVVETESVRERAARLGPPYAAARGWDHTARGLLAVCADACGRPAAPAIEPLAPTAPARTTEVAA